MATRTVAAILILAIAASGCLQQVQDTLRGGPDIHHPEALLRDDPYDRLVVEIDHVAGHEPSPLALDALKQRLGEVTDKKEIRIPEPTEIPAQGGGYDADDIRRIHMATFDRFGPDHQYRGSATLHILYLDGLSGTEPGFQGIYVTDFVRGEQTAAIALLPDHWRGPTGLGGLAGLPAPGADTFAQRIERSVLVHEAGHALGLVGTVPEQRERHDPDDPGHSTNPQSVMHSGPVRVDQDYMAFLRETGYDPVWAFDADDLADLKAYRDR